MPIVELITHNQTQRFPFPGNRFVVGRGSDCQAIILNDSKVSRQHCELVRYQGNYLLHDLKSRNGTLVAGKPVEVVKLVDKGVFQVGAAFLRFFLTDATANATPAGKYPSHMLGSAKAAASGGGAPIFQDDDDDEPIYDVAAIADGMPAAASASTRAYDSDEPLPLLDDEDDGDIPFATPAHRAAPPAPARSLGDDMGHLDRLATVGRDPGFALEDLALLNARGQVIHAAGQHRTAVNEALANLLTLCLGAVRINASDIHLEPKQYDCLLRLRVDGNMLEATRLTTDQAKRLVSMIKVLCDIDITRKSAIQEGHFSSSVPGRTIDYRVSFAPAMYGQKMVVRVLDPALSPQVLADLDLPRFIEESLRDTAEKSNGTVFVCGPTGSGKTTTLYAVLRQIDARSRNVITIEDPIEYEVSDVTQIPVNNADGHTFANLLRSCLRQDPDVIVLGEIRDQDTATTALHAATTGHLVLSTIHSNDAISTVLRLLDLGVEPYLIASTLDVILAQRLVRKLCDRCKKPYKADAKELKRLRQPEDADVNIYGPLGCDTCFNTGYAGRVGVFECLTTTNAVRDVILSKPNLVDLRRALEATDFKTLQDHAIERVLTGVSSLDDVHKTIGLD